MKKYYYLLVSALAFMAASTASAATLFPVGALNYTILSQKNAVMVDSPVDEEISGQVVIPSSVTIEGKEYTVTGIDGTAFKDCEGITSIVLPATIDSIGVQAFNGCKNMVSCNLGDTKIRTLSTSTFLYCGKLQTVTIPATVTEIGINPFMETLSLQNINVAEGNTLLKSIDGVLYSIDGKELIAFPGGHHSNATGYTVADGTETIINSAFCMARRLQGVTFPASVTRIESSAFLRADSIRLISLPANIKYVGASAFAECKLAAGEISLPASCTYLGSKAFYYTSISKLEIPSTVGTVPQMLCMYCVKLRSVSMAEGLTQIYSSAFNTCAISSIVVPNSVTRIRDSVFKGCTLLKDVTLGTGLTTIDTQVFYNLTGIQNIYCLATTPPNIADYANYPAFTTNVYTNCQLYVPQASVETYKEATTWKNFSKISSSGVEVSEADAVAVSRTEGGIAVMGATAPVEVYNMSGMRIYTGTDAVISLNAGAVYIVKVGAKVFKVAL